jgi:hypothetical protein
MHDYDKYLNPLGGSSYDPKVSLNAYASSDGTHGLGVYTAFELART